MRKIISILMLSLIGVFTIKADKVSDLLDSNQYIFIIEKRNSVNISENNQPYNWILIQNDTIIYQSGVDGSVGGFNWCGGITLMSNVEVKDIKKTDNKNQIEYQIYGTYLNGSLKIQYDYTDVYAEISINKNGGYSYYYGRIIPIEIDEIVIGRIFGSM